MKQIILSQEIVLFQDAIRSAHNIGMDFNPKDSDTIGKLTEIILDILKDIKEMCEIDNKCVADVEYSLHYVLFNKTLLSYDLYKDEERRQFYYHVCESLPSISWNLYTNCVVHCNWLELGEKIWVQEPASVQLIAYSNILKVINVSADSTTVIFFNILTKFINALIEDSSYENNYISESDFEETFENINITIEKKEIEQESNEKLINALTYFCTKLKSNMDALKSQFVTNLFNLLLKQNVTKFQTASKYKTHKSSLISCATAINYVLQINSDDLEQLQQFQDRIISEISMAYNDEEDMIKDLDVIDSKAQHFEGSLNRIINHLRTTPAVQCFECLKRNGHILMPNHVKTLLESRRKYSDETSLKLLFDVIEQAFKKWPLEEQDIFRKAFHQKNPLVNILSEDSDIDGQLTKTINILASTSELNKFVEIAADFSFLSLQDPVKSLTRLMLFAITSGQIAIITKILRHLTCSCQHQLVDSTSSFGTQVLYGFIQDELPPHQVTYLLTLVKDIIKEKILQPLDLFMKLFSNLKPDALCYKILSSLTEILKWGDEEDLRVIFIHTKPSILLLKLGRILHYGITKDLNKCQVNVIHIRKQILSLIQQFADKCLQSDFISEHEVCWLYVKLDQLNPTVIYNFKPILGSFENALVYRAGSLPLSDFLIAACSTTDDHQQQTKAQTKKENFNYEMLCCAIAKILPRITETELVNLPNITTSLLQHQYKDSTAECTLLTIHILTDAIVLLMQPRANNGDIPHYLQMAVANCTFLINDIVKKHHPMESKMWLSTVSLVVSMTERLKSSSKLGELLLIDLLTSKPPEVDDGISKIIFENVKKLNLDITDASQLSINAC